MDSEPRAEMDNDCVEATAAAPQPMSAGQAWARGKDIFRRLGPIGPLALVAASLPLVGTVGLVVLLKQTDLAPWLRGQDGLGVFLYVAAYVLVAGMALSGTYAPSLVGGFAFGVVTGSAAAMAGILGAATIAYVAARRASGDRVTALIAEQAKWKAVQDALLGSGPWRTLGIVSLIRLSSSPFAITNLVLGSTRVRPVIYLIGSILGFAPRTIAVVAIGSRLSNWDPQASSKWLAVGGIAVTLVVLGIIGTIANQAVQKVTNQDQAAPDSALSAQ